ncbi:MAG: hypothetical protein WCK46_02810 [Candidatus Adlerbacteria bacterium]
MGKQRAALVLVVMLLMLFAGWWGVAALQKTSSTSGATAAIPTHTTTKLPAYIAATLPLTIVHSKTKGVDTYGGTLTVHAGCSVLSSGISATGQHPAHITAVLTLKETAIPCSGTATTSSSTFAVSFEHTDTAVPVFDGVMLNGALAAYSLVEKN